MITTRDEIQAFITRDGSEIRELMHPAAHGNRAQSLAEAMVHPGQATLLHRHIVTEELYHVLEGEGVMTLGERQFVVKTGDTVLISPGTAHRICATGGVALRFLCCCTPGYSDADTELLQDGAPHSTTKSK